jgi:DNA repair photolyase
MPRDIIYRPTGRALEYSPLAVNLYAGCSHGCLYPCYAPGCAHKKPEDFFGNPEPRKQVIEDLELQAAKWIGEKERVLLCFLTDPYQPIDRECQLTRQALEILHANGFPTAICTKGGSAAFRDFDLMRAGGTQFGQTICFKSEALREKWEPGATSIDNRLATLREAHDTGIYTWISIEPLIDLIEACKVIEAAAPYCDEFRVGGWNYTAETKGRDWKGCAETIRTVLRHSGRRSVMKCDLAKYLSDVHPGQQYRQSPPPPINPETLTGLKI